MRIMHIGNVNNNANGVGQVIRQLSIAQKALGHEVMNLTAIVKQEELSDFKEIHSKKDFCLLIGSFKPDIFIFHSLYIREYLKFYPLLIKRNIPYLIELHGALSQENYKKNHLKKWLANQLFYKRFLKKAQTIIYLNKAEKEKSIVPAINPKSEIIPNGCAVTEPIHEIQHYPSNDINRAIRILFIGRIDIYHKALDVLTESINIYINKKNNALANFYFFGVGHTDNVRSFKRMISPLGNNVKFLGGIYGEEKENEYRHADIFILTSRFEGMPMGVLEALSHGIPCLVTPGTNMADIIKEYNCGWVVECNTESIADGLSNAINDYLQNSTQLRKNALNAAKHFSWTHIASKSIELYRKFAR